MQVKAQLNNLRIAPKKVRLVANLVKGLKVDAALNQLRFLNKKSADPISDLIKSAVANATNNFQLDKDNLKIKEIRVELGTTLKRFMPRAYGRANPILKKMSKIWVMLEEIKPSAPKVKTEKVSEKAEKKPADAKAKAVKPAKAPSFAKATEGKKVETVSK